MCDTALHCNRPTASRQPIHPPSLHPATASPATYTHPHPAPFMSESTLRLYELIRAGEVPFPALPDGTPLSAPLRSLLAGLLAKAPEQRLTLEQAAQHEWMTQVRMRSRAAGEGQGWGAVEGGRVVGKCLWARRKVLRRQMREWVVQGECVDSEVQAFSGGGVGLNAASSNGEQGEREQLTKQPVLPTALLQGGRLPALALCAHAAGGAEAEPLCAEGLTREEELHALTAQRASVKALAGVEEVTYKLGELLVRWAGSLYSRQAAPSP